MSLISGMANQAAKGQKPSAFKPKGPDALNKTLGQILASSAPSGARAQAARAAQGRARNDNGLFKAISIIDKPRAAFASALSELTDAASIALRLEGHEYLNVSFNEFRKGVNKNIGFGEILTEKVSAAGRKSGKAELFGINMGTVDAEGKVDYKGAGKWVSRGVGLVGDIGLDPLTYLAPGVGLAKAGGYKGIARGLMAADDPKMWEVGQRLLREKGTSSLSAQELKKINTLLDTQVKNGVFLTVPGTGRIARKVGLAKEGAQVQIAGGGVNRLTPRGLLDNARGKVAGTLSTRHISQALGGDFHKLRHAINAGTPEQARAAFTALDDVSRRRLRGRMVSDTLAQGLNGIRQAARAADADGADIQRLLDMDDVARQADPAYRAMEQAQPGIFNQVKEFNEFSRMSLNELAEVEFIVKNDHWRASLPTEAFQEYLANVGRSSSQGGGLHPAWFEKHALRAGEDFMGVELLPSSAHPQKLSIHEQMDEILEEAVESMGLDSVGKMFEPDYFTAMEGYLQAGIHRAVLRGTEEVLAQQGIAVSRFAKGVGAEAVRRDGIAKQWAARRQLADARMESKNRKAALDEAERDLAEAQAKANMVRRSGEMDTQRATAGDQISEARTASKLEELEDTARYTRTQAELAEREAVRLSHSDTARALEQFDIFSELSAKNLAEGRRIVDESAAAVQRLHVSRSDLHRAREDIMAKLAAVESSGNAESLVARRAEINDAVNAIEDKLAEVNAKIISAGVPADLAERIASATARLQRNEQIVKRMETFLAYTKPNSMRVHGYSADELDQIAKTFSMSWPADESARRKIRKDIQTILDQRAKPQIEGQRIQLKSLRAQQDGYGKATEAMLTQQRRLEAQLAGTRAKLQTLAQTEGLDPAAVERLTELDRRLATVNEMGYLENPIDETGLKLWFHGVSAQHDKLDLTLDPTAIRRNTGEVDTHFGTIHVTQDYTEASWYVPEAGPFTPDHSKIATIRIRASNPKVIGYEDAHVVNGVHIDDVMPREASTVLAEAYGEHWWKALRGNPYPTSKTQLLNEMLETALESGAIDFHDLARVDTDPMAGVVADHLAEAVDEGVNVWGMSYREAIGAAMVEDPAFQAKLLQRNRQIETARNVLLIRGFDEAEVDQWLQVLKTTDEDWAYSHYVVSNFYEEDAMGGIGRAVSGEGTNALNQRIGDAYKAKLVSEGFDSVMYHTIDSKTWAAVPLDAAQIERVPQDEIRRMLEVMGEVAPDAIDDVAENASRLVRTLDDLRNDIAAGLRTNNAALRDQEKAIGLRLSRVEASIQHSEMEWFDNMRQMDALENQLKQGRGTLARDVESALSREFAMRRWSDQLYEQAEQVMPFMETVRAERHAAAARLGRVAEDAELANRHAEAIVLRMEAAHRKALADFTKAGKSEAKASKAYTKLRDPKLQAQIEAVVIPNGWSKMGWDKMAPSHIVEALTESGKFHESGFMKTMLKHHDAFLNMWKGYAIMTPGFHMRNTFGGVFNNWLADIDPSRYKQYRRLSTAYFRTLRRGGSEEAAMAAMRKAGTSEEAMYFEQVLRSGIMSGGQTRELVERGAMSPGNFNPLSGNNVAIRANSQGVNVGSTGFHVPGARDVENMLRGSLAMDTMFKTGGDINAAIDSVFKYHFDYDDLSRFERSVTRRAIPFYTWTRKNLPLQIEGIVTQPKNYTRFLAFQRNIELGTEEQEITPSWFADTLSIRLPFKMGDTQSYLLPDLPYKDISRTTNVREIMAMTSPTIKTPMEMWAGKRFFADIPFKEGMQEAPESWNKLGITQLAALMPAGIHATKNAEGKWMMSDKDIYKIEQFMPLLGRARRIAPSEDKYKQRQSASLLSMALGIGFRANTQADQDNEIWRREQDLQRQKKLLQDLGHIEKKAVAK